MLSASISCCWFCFSAEYPGENFIDVAQLTLQVESAINLSAGDAASDFFVIENKGPEIQTFFPCLHGVSLHHAVCILTGDAIFHEIEQELPDLVENGVSREDA